LVVRSASREALAAWHLDGQASGEPCWLVDPHQQEIERQPSMRWLVLCTPCSSQCLAGWLRSSKVGWLSTIFAKEWRVRSLEPSRAKPTQLMSLMRWAWGGSQSAIARRSAPITTGICTPLILLVGDEGEPALPGKPRRGCIGKRCR
jgi:hypothetical protein